MKNYNDFHKLSTELLSTYTHLETINDDYREMILNIKYNNAGQVQLLFKEQFDYDNNPEFFILYMVELDNAYHNIEFKRYLWEKDENINRVASISWDISNDNIVICLSKRKENEYDSYLVDRKRIIIEPNSDKGIEYTMGSKVTRAVKVEDIMDAIKNKNVAKLFRGIGSYDEEAPQKVMKRRPN